MGGVIHNYCNAGNKHPLYKRWTNIKQRCYDKNSNHYKDYGNRGISMHPDWLNNPKVFIEWCLTNGWENKLQIDRIDNNGDYRPGNIRFVTNKINMRNRRNNVLTESLVDKIRKEYNEGVATVKILSKKYNINIWTLHDAIGGRTWV